MAPIVDYPCCPCFASKAFAGGSTCAVGIVDGDANFISIDVVAMVVLLVYCGQVLPIVVIC